MEGRIKGRSAGGPSAPGRGRTLGIRKEKMNEAEADSPRAFSERDCAGYL